MQKKSQNNFAELTPQPNRRACLMAAGAGVFMAAWPGLVRAAGAFPTKPITLVVPFGAGGVADITARTLAQAMQPVLGQSVIIDNRPGAGGITGTSAVVRARPDGYTLLLVSNATAISATLLGQQKFDVQKDLEPVGMLGHFDLAICVAENSAHRNLQDLINFAQKNPGKLNIGTIAVGSTQNLTAEMLRTQAKIDALIVPYKNTPDALAALRAGDVDVVVEIITPLMGHIRSQALRVLAITAAQRNAQLPDVPTLAQAGLPGLHVSSWNALAAPRGLPEPVRQTLSAALQQALQSAEVRDKLAPLGVRLDTGGADTLAALLDSEIRRWRGVIQTAGIAVQ